MGTSSIIDPAQPTGLGEVLFAGASGVAVDAFGGDLGAFAAFEGLVETDMDGAQGCKGGNKEFE